jgi:hypothetical protein
MADRKEKLVDRHMQGKKGETGRKRESGNEEEEGMTRR